MAISINGSNNTIGGVAVGGLPDGIVDTDMLAANAVTLAKSSGREILQVLETRLDAGFTTESTTYVDVTNLSKAITMTNASNKVLIEAPLWVSQNYTNSYIYIAIYKGSTLLQVSGNMPGESNMFANQGKWTFMSYIDTPGAGTHTYKIMCKSENSNKTAKISVGGNESSHSSEKPDMVIRLTEIAA
tara:strand:- start:40 stop:600 length:561 start_codon:yes stop_codon:yes gene_type:complete